jgi:hypothetical protein
VTVATRKPSCVPVATREPSCASVATREPSCAPVASLQLGSLVAHRLQLGGIVALQQKDPSCARVATKQDPSCAPVTTRGPSSLDILMMLAKILNKRINLKKIEIGMCIFVLLPLTINQTHLLRRKPIK